MPSTGYATYRLNTLVVSRQKFTLKIADISTNYRLFVDNKQSVEIGHPKTGTDKTMAKYYPTIVQFESKGVRVELVLQVSNFDDQLGGIWLTHNDRQARTSVFIPRIPNCESAFFYETIQIVGLYNLM